MISLNLLSLGILFLLAAYCNHADAYISVAPLSDAAIYDRSILLPDHHILLQSTEHVVQTVPSSSPTTGKDRIGEGEKDTLFLIHTTLQQEAATLVDLAGSLANKTTTIHTHQIEALSSLLSIHASQMVKHIQSTEEFLLPKFVAKVSTSLPVEWIQASHEKLQERLHRLEQQLHQRQTNGGSLLQDFRNYQQELAQHFAMQQRSIVLPSRAAMSNFQWAWTIQRYMEKGGVDMGSFIHHLGVHVFRTEWMTFCKLPAFLWRLHFQSGLERFQAQWTAHFDKAMAKE